MWIDGYIDVWIGGWIGGWIDWGGIDGRTDVWIEGWLDGLIDGWIEGRIDGWIDADGPLLAIHSTTISPPHHHFLYLSFLLRILRPSHAC